MSHGWSRSYRLSECVRVGVRHIRHLLTILERGGLCAAAKTIAYASPQSYGSGTTILFLMQNR
jgi:hypothetical protein